MLYFEIVYQLVLPETLHSLASMTKLFSNLLSLSGYILKNLIHKLLPLFSYLVNTFSGFHY